MPSSVDPVAIMIINQKLSWASGQLYFRRSCRTRIVSRTSGILPGWEVDEEEDEEDMVGDLVEGIWEDRRVGEIIW